MFGWLFVCLITIQGPMANLPQILIGEFGRATGMSLAIRFEILNWVGSLLTGKIAKIK